MTSPALRHTKESPIDWTGSIPFLTLWATGIIGPFFTGLSSISVAVAILLYYVRMFFVTAFLHRYFSHKSYRVNRFWQFIFAILTCLAVQNGPCWWAAHHRHHHQHSDTEKDFHSNFWWGFLESHVLWFLRINSQKTDWGRIGDLKRYPEIRAFDNKLIYIIPPTLLALGCYWLGSFLGDDYGTNGWQMMIVGFFLSTFILHNGTFTINSISHMWGKQRYADTGDMSLNNWFLAIFVTLGEGWHNNHHKHQYLVRQGHTPWEIDITYYGIKLLEALGIARGLRMSNSPTT